MPGKSWKWHIPEMNGEDCTDLIHETESWKKSNSIIQRLLSVFYLREMYFYSFSVTL